MKVYTKEELLDIVASDAHPEARRIAGGMLFAMGEREELFKSIQKTIDAEQAIAEAT